MAVGTTEDFARMAMAKSKQSRPATGGNKNLNSRARRSESMGQFSKTRGMTDRVFAGPDRGRG